jgi:hypothetical protein
MAESTSSIFPLLIEISHPSLTEPFRLVNNTVDLTYNGNVYTAYPFRIDPPDESREEIGNASITIDNIEGQILVALRSYSEAFTVKLIAMFWNDDSGTLFEEIAQWEFQLTNITYNSKTITGQLLYEDRLMNKLPKLTFDPQSFPGVH